MPKQKDRLADLWLDILRRRGGSGMEQPGRSLRERELDLRERNLRLREERSRGRGDPNLRPYRTDPGFAGPDAPIRSRYTDPEFAGPQGWGGGKYQPAPFDPDAIENQAKAEHARRKREHERWKWEREREAASAPPPGPTEKDELALEAARADLAKKQREQAGQDAADFFDAGRLPAGIPIGPMRIPFRAAPLDPRQQAALVREADSRLGKARDDEAAAAMAAIKRQQEELALEKAVAESLGYDPRTMSPNQIEARVAGKVKELVGKSGRFVVRKDKNFNDVVLWQSFLHGEGPEALSKDVEDARRDARNFYDKSTVTRREWIDRMKARDDATAAAQEAEATLPAMGQQQQQQQAPAAPAPSPQQDADLQELRRMSDSERAGMIESLRKMAAEGDKEAEDLLKRFEAESATVNPMAFRNNLPETGPLPVQATILPDVYRTGTPRPSGVQYL